jgi:hypothetical protein
MIGEAVLREMKYKDVSHKATVLITHIVHIPDPRLKFFKLKKKFTLLIFAQ